MRFRFVVEVMLNKESGKFAGKEAMSEQIRDTLEDLNPGEYQTEDGSYGVESWEVREYDYKGTAEKIIAKADREAAAAEKGQAVPVVTLTEVVMGAPVTKSPDLSRLDMGDDFSCQQDG